MRREFLLWATKNSSKCFQQYATRKMTPCFIVASIAADCCNFKFHDWISLSSGVCVRVFACVLRAATLKPGMNLYTGHCCLYQAIILNLVVSQTVREKQKDIGVICKNKQRRDRDEPPTDKHIRASASLSKYMKKVCLFFKKQNKHSLIISCETSWFNKPCQQLRHLALPSWWPPAENISQLMLRFPAAALAQMWVVLTLKWQKKKKSCRTNWLPTVTFFSDNKTEQAPRFMAV